MKQGWEIKQLGEVCEIYQPKTIAKKLMIPDGNYPVFGANGIIGRYDKYNHEQSELIIGCRGSCGSVNISKPMSWINGNAMVIRPKIQELDRRILRYFLIGGMDFKNIITGSSIPQITRKSIYPITIPIPPHNEQKRIVAKLDECFEAINTDRANVEKNLQNAKELFQSQLNQIFTQKGDGWVDEKLGEVCEEFGRGKSKHRPRNDKKLFGGDYPFVQTGDVRNAQKIITEYSQTYNEIGLAQSKQWRKGTVCITIAANIAETAILGFSACFPDSIIGFNADSSKTTNQYVYYLLQFYKEHLQKLGKGSAQDNINLGTFNNQSFPFPNLENQNQIVEILDRLKAQTQSLESNYQQELDALDELKKSILEKAFNGEL